MITREQLTVGTRLKTFNDESIWTVCNDEDYPERGQFTEWAYKPAFYATFDNEEGTHVGIVLFTEVEKFLD